MGSFALSTEKLGAIILKRRESLNAKHFPASLNISGRPSLLGDWVLRMDSHLHTIDCFGTFSGNVSPCRPHQTSCKIACSSPRSSAVRFFSVDKLFHRRSLIRGYPNGRGEHSNTRRLHKFPAVGQLVFFHRLRLPLHPNLCKPWFWVDSRSSAFFNPSRCRGRGRRRARSRGGWDDEGL